MKNLSFQFKKHSVKIAGVTLGVLLPVITHAQAFGSGMVIPSGTTTNVTSAIGTYFFPTILATAFQNQVIQIVVVLAAVWVMWRIVRGVIGAIRHPGH